MNFSPGVSIGSAKRERVGLFAGTARIKRPDPNLVGERRERREHLGAAHHEAAIGLAHDAQRDERIGLLGRAFRAIDLRIDQRMRQAPIVVAALLVIADEFSA